MAFLHRVVNGGGSIEREYAIGRGRMDLCLRLGAVTVAMELKAWRDGRPDPLPTGLAQLDGYLDGLGLPVGWLVIFDERSRAEPTSIRTRSEHVCAVTSTAQVACWGKAGDGKLGTPADQDQRTPVVVPDVEDAVGVAQARERDAAAHRERPVRVDNADGVRCLSRIASGIEPGLKASLAAGALHDGSAQRRHGPGAIPRRCAAAASSVLQWPIGSTG